MPQEMRPFVLLFTLVVYLLPVPGQRLIPPKKYHAEDDDDVPALPDEDEDDLETNTTTTSGKNVIIQIM